MIHNIKNIERYSEKIIYNTPSHRCICYKYYYHHRYYISYYVIDRKGDFYSSIGFHRSSPIKHFDISSTIQLEFAKIEFCLLETVKFSTTLLDLLTLIKTNKRRGRPRKFFEHENIKYKIEMDYEPEHNTIFN